MTADPAQSAPSAAQIKEAATWRTNNVEWEWYEHTDKVAEVLATYAALRTAQLERELEELELDHIAYIEQSRIAKDAFCTRAETAESALAAQKWVKVSECLPDPEATVLWCKVPIQEPPVVGCLADGTNEEYFTHWMAMPNEFWPTDAVAAQTPEEK